MEIIAHRGSSHLAPENTLASLRLGWQEITTCELDIRPTRDGRLLVIHDDSTLRTTGIDFPVARHSLAELQKLDAGSWKGAPWQGEKLPSLEQAIAAMPSDKRLFIKIKAGPEVIPELQRVIRASGKEKQLMLQSFSYAACVEARRAFSGIPIYLLIDRQPDPSLQANAFTLDEAFLQARSAGLNGINVNAAALARNPEIQNIHSAGLKLQVWTVDDVAEARRFLDLGVDGLTTNRPGWLKAQLGLS